MKIIKCKDYNEMSKEAAKIVASQIKQNPNSVLGLATGQTPVGMYKELIEMYKKSKVSFAEVKSFNLDEYYPIKRDDLQSYYYFMFDNLFNHVDIKKENVNILDGETLNGEKECEDFENLIEKHGGVDLQVLGIGQNGHIGFNEPNEFLESKTHITGLSQDTIIANSRFFEKESDVPKKALTMGIGTIMKAKKIILLASGKAKADAVEKLLSGKITTNNPASILNAHGDVTIIVDQDALK